MSKRKKPDSEVPTGAEDIEINEALLGEVCQAALELAVEQAHVEVTSPENMSSLC